MRLIKRSYKYRMYPNKTQEELLAKTFGCVRVIWNACVDSFNSYDEETNPNPKFPTKSDLVIEKPWLNEVSAATLQQKQRDFIEFSRQYFNKNRKEKLGKPNYKNKHDNQSFRLPFPKFKIADNKIRIEKIGWVKIVIDRGVPDNARFISCTVSKNRAGQYFVSVLVETEQCYKQKTGKTVGVDLGIKTLATLSDGIAVENSHFLCENQAKLKRMQRHLSRKKLGSNRRNKCRLKVSRLHRDIANKRSWYMHNLTTMLVNNYDVICIEDLNTSGMLQNHKLAGSVSDASFSMFRNQLEYKCRWYGKELIVIDRFYPSSKTCSRSGQRQYMEKPKRTGGAVVGRGSPEGRGLPPSLGITLSLPLLDSYHENFSHRHKIHIPNKDQLLYNYRLIHNHHPNLHNFHLKPEYVIQICK